MRNERSQEGESRDIRGHDDVIRRRCQVQVGIRMPERGGSTARRPKTAAPKEHYRHTKIHLKVSEPCGFHLLGDNCGEMLLWGLPAKRGVWISALFFLLRRLVWEPIPFSAMDRR